MRAGWGDGAHSESQRGVTHPLMLFEIAHCRGLDYADVGLDHESRGEPKGIPGVVGVRGAVGAHTAEGGAVVPVGTIPE